MAELLADSAAARSELEALRVLDLASADALAIDDARPVNVSAAWRGFEQRVAPPVSTRWTHWAVGTVALIAATVLLIVAWPNSRVDGEGTLRALRRETVAIGEHAVAAAEPAAALQWKVRADGHARVRQEAGAVFYRVDAGDEFIVDTVAGQVTVTGTCFTVELDEMTGKSKYVASAAVGAALTATVALTVHEGTVLLANDDGQMQVEAGQRAVMSAGSVPRMIADQETQTRSTPGSKSTYTALVRESREQRQQLEELQAQIKGREAPQNGRDKAPHEVDRESPEHLQSVAERCGKNGRCEFEIWVEPTDKELAELAKCNRLLIDAPRFMGGGDFFPDGKIIEAAGLSEAEAGRYAQAAEHYQAQAGQRLAELGTQLGLPTPVVQRLSPAQLMGMVESLVDSQTQDDMRAQLSRERAGLAQRPPSEGAAEQALRYVWGMGADFEAYLARKFDPQMAREMRRAHGGWELKGSLGDGECE